MDDNVKAQVEAIHAAPDEEAAELELALLVDSDNGPQDTDPQPEL